MESLHKGQWYLALIFLWCVLEQNAEQTARRRFNKDVLVIIWHRFQLLLKFVPKGPIDNK